MQVEPTEAYARQRDADDGLARFREEFYRNPDTLYLDGNSLGLLSMRAEKSLLRVLDQWKTLAINGWMQAEPPWFTFAEELARRTAPLIGAHPDEVIVTNSTTVNLHQLLATLYTPSLLRAERANRERGPGGEVARTAIVTDATAFPTDRYALDSHLKMRGCDPATDLRIVPSRDGYTIDKTDILAAMTEEVQMAVLPAVIYTSGQLLDMAALTAEAHRRGILIGFDCSHSIGVVPHHLSEWDVDFAFWCNYKYLNGGPGATGGLYLNRRHHDRLPGLAGWFGSRKEMQFNMAPEMEPAEGASRLQLGTPNLLSMAPLLGALEMMEEAGIEHIRAKSLALTDFLMALVETELSAFGFRFANPKEAERRGGHVALVHPEAVRICKALKAVNVVPDFRPPSIVRLAPVPLYTSFLDCFEAIGRLRGIMEARHYAIYAMERELVA